MLALMNPEMPCPSFPTHKPYIKYNGLNSKDQLSLTAKRDIIAY